VQSHKQLAARDKLATDLTLSGLQTICFRKVIVLASTWLDQEEDLLVEAIPSREKDVRLVKEDISDAMRHFPNGRSLRTR
jgi:hypothetical protein